MNLRPLALVSAFAGFAGLAIACAAPDDGAEAAAEQRAWTPHRPADPASCPSTEVAGRLTLFVTPPSTRLDWSTPNRLIAGAIKGELSEAALEREGKVALPHSIGHVNVELDCGADSVALTGQTGGGAQWKSAVDGFGILLRAYAGSMNGFPDQAAKVREDIRRREANGLVSRVSFLVSEAQCKRVKEFHDAYVARRAYERYAGHFRSRRFEGGGCGIWAADVIDVAGLLRRSVYTPLWAQSLMVGQRRFSNVLGADHYAFGSNLVWRGPDGRSVIWPAGVDVPTRGWPTVPGAGWLDHWSGSDDDAFGVPGAVGPIERKLPFSIYDPMLMNDWAERVWSEASGRGAATSLETRWTAGTAGKAHEITTDAHCTPPQTIPFEADNDDLYKDSDQP